MGIGKGRATGRLGWSLGLAAMLGCGTTGEAPSEAVVEAPAAPTAPAAPATARPALGPARPAERDQPVAVVRAPQPVAVVRAPESMAVVRAPQPVAVVRAPQPVAAPATEARRVAQDDQVDDLLGSLDGNRAGHAYPSPAPVWQPPVADTERYSPIVDQGWKNALDEPLSTFSIDVDTASYANVRRFLEEGQLPPPDAVRIEEMLNYFTYRYPEPHGEHPLAVHAELAEAPWSPTHRLLKVGLQGRRIQDADLPPANLVFLVDVSGSMAAPDRLPLLTQSLALLVRRLRPQDQVALVVYAGAAGLVLPPTSGAEQATLLNALGRLNAGGSTAGGEGIRLAYQVARGSWVQGGNNRVILATDGDFNVGTQDDDALVQLIEQERKSGVFLTILGFGRGNYQDAKMEKLSNAGNGNAAYIDSLLEAEKVLVSEMGGTLTTIAQDVKLQIEFNPSKVKGYRLIGYENRILAAKDFNDDSKDAGELGSGHTVTALYEIVPADSDELVPGVDPLRYQAGAPAPKPNDTSELLFLKLRYQRPGGSPSVLVTTPIEDRPRPLAECEADFRFASAVAELGLLLRDSPYKGAASFEALIERARAALGEDREGYRTEFLGLAQKARRLKGLGAEVHLAR